MVRPRAPSRVEGEPAKHDARSRTWRLVWPGRIVGAMESERTRHLGLFVVLGLFAWTAALPPPLDLDMFAHLRIGAWVLEHGRLIREDPFSQQGGPYISYAWPFSVGASLVFERFGWVGILVAKCAMFTVAAVLIARLLERR